MATATAMATEIKKAIVAACPIVLVVSQDLPGAQAEIVSACLSLTQQPNVFAHSSLFGLEPLTEQSSAEAGKVLQGMDPAMFTDPAELLRTVASCDRSKPTVIVWWGADRAWNDPALAEAVMLLRDRLTSSNGNEVVMLCGIGAGKVTSLLADSIHTIRHELPSDEDRSVLIRTMVKDNEVQAEEGELDQAVNLTRGLTTFAVTQVTALASLRSKVDLTVMAERWREQMRGLPGVTVERPMPREWLGGCGAVIQDLEAYRKAKPSVVILLDEVEKCVSTPGTSRDSGASDAVLAELLSYLNDSEPAGAIWEGVPGTGKTLGALVAGTIFNCPVIRVSPGRIKGGIVGETERNAERVFSTLRAFGGLQYWAATSNNLETVPEELADRFPSGVWFYDLPNLDEIQSIWTANLSRYGLDTRLASRLAAEGWTGRDCRAVCLEAKRKGADLVEIASQRIPAGMKMRRRIERMREAARSEGYRSASSGLAYTGPTTKVVVSKPRKIQSEDMF
jgi:hypothetical protein